jgi:hypothetical protein
MVFGSYSLVLCGLKSLWPNHQVQWFRVPWGTDIHYAVYCYRCLFARSLSEQNERKLQVNWCEQIVLLAVGGFGSVFAEVVAVEEGLGDGFAVGAEG